MEEKKDITLEEQIELNKIDLELQDRVKISSRDRRDNNVRYTSTGIERDYNTEFGVITVTDRIRPVGQGREWVCDECGQSGDFDWFSESNGQCQGCGLILRNVEAVESIEGTPEAKGMIGRFTEEEFDDYVDDLIDQYIEDEMENALKEDGEQIE